MTGSSFQGCPWTLLGIDRTASPDKVREAYRKMALRYHPDLNKGCAKASQRFQLIKEAFEDIQTRQEAERLHRSFTSRHRQGGYSSRYRYSNTSSNPGSAGSTFHGFRRDRRAYPDFQSGYQDETYERRTPRNTNQETLRAMRTNVRQMERAGLGLGVLLAGTTVCAGVLIMDYAWNAKNHGKSFETLMKSLDEKTSNADTPKFKKRGPPSSS